MRREVYSHATLAGGVAIVAVGLIATLAGPVLQSVLRIAFGVTSAMTVARLAYSDASLDELRMRRILLLTTALMSASLIVE